MFRSAVCVALIAALAGVATAQQPPRDTPAQRPDSAKPTSLIAGRVMAADTGKPVARARVFVTAPELPTGRGVLTDDTGHGVEQCDWTRSVSISRSEQGATIRLCGPLSGVTPAGMPVERPSRSAISPPERLPQSTTP